MSAAKKNDREKLAHPAKEDSRHKINEEYDQKSKMLKERKVRRVNYIVKDLPIY